MEPEFDAGATQRTRGRVDQQGRAFLLLAFDSTIDLALSGRSAGSSAPMSSARRSRRSTSSARRGVRSRPGGPCWWCCVRTRLRVPGSMSLTSSSCRSTSPLTRAPQTSCSHHISVMKRSKTIALIFAALVNDIRVFLDGEPVRVLDTFDGGGGFISAPSGGGPSGDPVIAAPGLYRGGRRLTALVAAEGGCAQACGRPAASRWNPVEHLAAARRHARRPSLGHRSRGDARLSGGNPPGGHERARWSRSEPKRGCGGRGCSTERARAPSRLPGASGHETRPVRLGLEPLPPADANPVIPPCATVFSALAQGEALVSRRRCRSVWLALLEHEVEETCSGFNYQRAGRGLGLVVDQRAPETRPHLLARPGLRLLLGRQ